jgi:glutamate 5-kinase
MTRERLREARRIVVKVGTTSLTDGRGKLDPGKVEALVDELCGVLSGGREVVLVTSGAIAAGLGPLGFEKRPSDMPTLQAAAAVGQSHLMDAYASAFETRGRVCGQVLLTRHDFVHRAQYVNAKNTFRRLLALGAVPVVNENDTIATDEIRFGENDLLASLVAHLVDADAVVLLSDVDGLHDGPGGALIPEVESVTPSVEALAGPKGSAYGSGGMRTKLDAARIATRSGVSVVIARSRRGALARIIDGKPVGTFFHPARGRLKSRKAWIAFATEPKGSIVVDAGAREALASGGRSLLAAGVRGVEGSFIPGDAVDIAEGGHAFARGLVNYSAEELRAIAGQTSRERREVVHRDELVVL